MNHTNSCVLEIHPRRPRGVCAGGDSSPDGSCGSGRRAAGRNGEIGCGSEDERRDRLREDGWHHHHYVRVYGRRGRVLFSGHERWALRGMGASGRLRDRARRRGPGGDEASGFCFERDERLRRATVRRPDARVAAGPDTGRPPAEARVPKQLHQLPPAQLHSAEQV